MDSATSLKKKMSKGVLLEFGSKENSDDKRNTYSYLLSFVQQYAEKYHIVATLIPLNERSISSDEKNLSPPKKTCLVPMGKLCLIPVTKLLSTQRQE